MGWIVELEAEGRYRLPHSGRRGPLGRALYSLWCGVESLLLGESIEEILPLIDDEFLETSCSEDYESSNSDGPPTSRELWGKGKGAPKAYPPPPSKGKGGRRKGKGNAKGRRR